jgi:acylphosphatase
MSSRSRLHLRIIGKVQGVFFRASSQGVALELGLGGWVRNRKDGSVELVAEGPEDTIRVLSEWCQTGPEMAEVQSVEATWEEPIGMELVFDIRPTT